MPEKQPKMTLQFHLGCFLGPSRKAQNTVGKFLQIKTSLDCALVVGKLCKKILH